MSADITQAADAGMVERVARALFLAEHPGGEWSAGRARMKWFHLAETAIFAMREPTPAMIDSGVAFALCVSINGEYRWSEYVADKHRAMIDAALGKPL